MTDLEITHISDLHWDSTKSVDANVVIKPLLEDLRRSIGEGLIAPDLLAFTGDLVNAGETPSEFESAYEAFVAPAMDILGLDKDRVFICPGNHDISRKIARSSSIIEGGARNTLTSVNATNKFLDGLKQQNLNDLVVIERIENYYNFVDKYFSKPEFKSSLMRCWATDINGMKVGVAGFDTAWRATGEADDVDRHNLLLGERNVDDAVDALQAQDVRVALMHHPAEWLADFDEAAVSSRLSAHFDLIMCGHMHKSNPQTRTTPQGTAVLSQTGSAYAGRNWFNGYQTVKLDFAAGEAKFIIRSFYDIPRRVFDKATNVTEDGIVHFPFDTKKKSSSNAVVESFLREHRAGIRQAATKHYRIVDSEAISSLDAKEAYIVPPLSKRVKGRDAALNTDTLEDRFEDISVEQVLRSEGSFVCSGGREAGKTGLLHYMSVLAAEGVIDRPRIPVIIDAEVLGRGWYEIRKAITSYYGAIKGGFDIDSALRQGLFLFLIDSYTFGSDGSDAIKILVKGREKDPGQNRFFVITQPRKGSITQDADIADELASFGKVSIGVLPRKSIRALSKNWSSVIGAPGDEVFESVMRQLKADGLPRTGYMVTLILWAMQQDKKLDRLNEAMLLANVVDHLLDKADFTKSIYGKLDPKAKQITLEYFAQYTSDSGNFVSINSATLFLIELFNKKRLPFVASDVIEELVGCGILDRRDSMIGFKYKCFEEYFYARRMKSDRALLEHNMRPGNYENRQREIELLSGIQRENKDIIASLVNDLEDRMPPEVTDVSTFDIIMLSKLSIGFEVSAERLNDLRKKKLTAEQVDDLLDAAERRAIERNDKKGSGSDAAADAEKAKEFALTPSTPNAMAVGEYVEAIELLGRIVRNSDFTDYEDKYPAARLYVEAFGKICVIFHKQMGDIIREQQKKYGGSANISDDDARVLLYVMTMIISRIASDRFVEQLSSPNIAPLMSEMISEKGVSGIERMFIAFLLQVIRGRGWEKDWSALLKDAGKSGIIMENSIARMRTIVNWQFLNDREHEKLHKVIDATEEVLGWSGAQKGAMIENLKQVALQAELRDNE